MCILPKSTANARMYTLRIKAQANCKLVATWDALVEREVTRNAATAAPPKKAGL